MSEWTGFGVLLVRTGVQGLDPSFTYRGERLPAVGDQIEITRSSATMVLATVTGIEPTKSLPIRATEDVNTTVDNVIVEQREQ
jgi:hypothetical protein